MGAAALPLMVGGGAASAYLTGQQGKVQQSYYNYLSDTAKTNAGLAGAVADSNLKALGYQESQDMRHIGDKIRATGAAQVAAEAAGGAGASSKTAEQIASDTANKGNLDEMALRYNAALKAKAIRTGASMTSFNYLNEAAGDELSGRNARTSANNSMATSILGSGSLIASSFARFPNYGGTNGGR